MPGRRLPLPEGVPTRLAELADLARPSGRGLRWRWYAESGADVGTMAGWCNGSAGFVFLWTLAHQILGDPRWRELAEGTAWNVWEAPDSHGTLCCGLAGRAYALLNLWKHGGGDGWLTRARDLAGHAARGIERTAEATEAMDSLYKGAVGVAVAGRGSRAARGGGVPVLRGGGLGSRVRYRVDTQCSRGLVYLSLKIQFTDRIIRKGGRL